MSAKAEHVTLLPCPFCFHEAHMLRTKDMTQWFYAECSMCYSRQLASESETEAAHRWNTRGAHWNWRPIP